MDLVVDPTDNSIYVTDYINDLVHHFSSTGTILGQFTTAISGPRDVLQLRENLRMLEAPDLPADRFAALRAFGDRVHADNREFFELVRWR